MVKGVSFGVYCLLMWVAIEALIAFWSHVAINCIKEGKLTTTAPHRTAAPPPSPPRLCTHARTRRRRPPACLLNPACHTPCTATECPCLRRHTARASPGVSPLPAHYEHTKREGRAQGKRTPVPGAGCWCGSSHNEMCPALALDRLITSPGRDIETEDDTVTDGVMTCYILG